MRGEVIVYFSMAAAIAISGAALLLDLRRLATNAASASAQLPNWFLRPRWFWTAPNGWRIAGVCLLAFGAYIGLLGVLALAR